MRKDSPLRGRSRGSLDGDVRTGKLLDRRLVDPPTVHGVSEDFHGIRRRVGIDHNPDVVAGTATGHRDVQAGSVDRAVDENR